MVAAPFGYVGLAIALLLVGGILGGLWFLVHKMVGVPQKQVSAQRALPAGEKAGVEKASVEKVGEKALVSEETS